MTRNRVPLGGFARRLIPLAARGGRFSPLALWQHWEPAAMWLWRVRPVRPGAILQCGASRYWGRSTVLADGTRVAFGARILHLHLDNRRVAAAVGPSRASRLGMAGMVDADLRALAENVAAERFGEVVALRGVTVLAGVARRFGFEIRPLPRSARWSLVHDLAGWVIAVYHPAGVAQAVRGVPWPSEVWMSAVSLQARVHACPPGDAVAERARSCGRAPAT